MANHRIVQVDNLSGEGWKAFGSLGSGDFQFNCPTAIYR